VNLLFDLDGTLIDPRRAILGCFRHALSELGAQPPSDGELERLIGPPLHECFSTLLCDETDVGQAIVLYRERFRTTGVCENFVYPGIADALAALRHGGARLFLATAKPVGFADRVLEHLNLRSSFDGVYGSEFDGRNAKKNDLLAHLLSAESLSAANSVMIGDRAHDVVAARAHGIFSVGVLWGFGSREELITAGADLICDTPANLLRVLLHRNF
jgi:phosphoglycolate phosphatase